MRCAGHPPAFLPSFISSARQCPLRPRCISSVPDLHFSVAALRAHDRYPATDTGGAGIAMKSLIRPGAGPFIVDHAERGIAILHRVIDNPHRHQIVDLFDRDFLSLHLLIDRIGALQPALDAPECLRAAAPTRSTGESGQKLLVGVAAGFDGAKISSCARIHVAGEILQLAHLPIPSRWAMGA